MTTIYETHQDMINDPKHWSIYLMNFVDDFRRHPETSSIKQPIEPADLRFDALVASTTEYLCDEQKILVLDWTHTIPACRDPWFVSGIENLKAIALAESPLRFRIRKIFVLHNFLQRA